MRILTPTVLAAAILVASPALATDWQTVAMGGNKADVALIFVDKESLKLLPNGMARGWMIVVTKTIAERELVEASCPDDRMHNLTVAMLSPTGAVLQEMPTAAWSYPAPGTPTYDVMKYVCSSGTFETDTTGTGIKDSTPIAYARKIIDEYDKENRAKR